MHRAGRGGCSGAIGRRRFSGWAFSIAIFAAAGAWGYFGGQAYAENADIASRRNSERLSFTDNEIAEGFFKVAFGAELQFGGKEERIRKFDEPVRVFVDNRAARSRTSEIAAAVANIGARIAHLDIAMTEDPDSANLIVVIVRERDFARTLQARFGAEKAKALTHSLAPVCMSGIGKDETYRIRHAEVFLPGDVDSFTFSDCVYEELLQALGPINDTDSVPWTMFNDKVQMGFFDRYDQYLLNLLYHPRIQPGMTKEEVKLLLPEVLPEVRARVASLSAPSVGHPR